MNSLKELIFNYWVKGKKVVFTLFISMGFSILYPLYPKWGIEVLNSHWNGEYKYRYIIILFLLFFLTLILKSLFNFINQIEFFKFQKKVNINIQEKILDAIFSYPLHFFDKKHSGNLTERLRTDVVALSFIFSERFLSLFINMLKIIIISIILIVFSIKFFLISIGIYIIIAAFIIFYKKHIDVINSRLLKSLEETGGQLSDIFQGIEVIKVFSIEKKEKYNVLNILKKIQDIEIERNKIFSIYFATSDFIINLIMVVTFYFGFIDVINKRILLSNFIAVWGYIGIFSISLRDIANSLVYFSHSKESYFRIQELLNSLPEDSGEKIIDRIKEIEVKNLGFSYDGEREIIKGLNFRIGRGDKVLVKGRSGSGKSTLIKLMLGLYKPKDGGIYYNGINLKELELKSLREKIGYISQNIFLFNRSVRDNIVLEEERKISDDEIKRVLKECGLFEKIEALTGGLDYMISEKGYNFSGGERQRIALARALIKEPEVIILLFKKFERKAGCFHILFIFNHGDVFLFRTC